MIRSNAEDEVGDDHLEYDRFGTRVPVRVPVCESRVKKSAGEQRRRLLLDRETDTLNKVRRES